jgi:hypothetical protein
MPLQVLTTAPVFDYEYTPDNLPLVNAEIYVWLTYDLATMAAPAVVLESKKLRVTTDATGYWTLNLVPNPLVAPANTVYAVKTPYRTYLISVPNGAGPYQASSIMVSGAALLPANPTTIPGPLSIGAKLTITAGGEDVTGTSIFRGSVQMRGPDPWFDVMGYGAAGDGVTNDYAAINSAIVAATTNGGIVYFPPGTYLVGTTLAPASNVTLMGAGPGASIIKGTNDTTVITGSSLSEVTIRDLQVQVQTGVGTPNGIILNTCSKVLIQNVEVFNAWDSIDLLAGCTDALVLGCTVRSAKQQGIQVSGASARIRIEGNSINGVGTTNLHHGIYLSGGWTDVAVVGNTVVGAFGFGIQAYATAGTPSRLTISGNTCSGNGLAGAGTNGGIYTGGTVQVTDVSVTGNVCVNNTNGYGIMVDGVQRAAVSGNVCKGNSNGLLCQVVTGGLILEVVISGNDLSANTSTNTGLRLNQAAGTVNSLVITGNVIRDHSGAGGAGIYATGTIDNMVILGNDLRNNTIALSVVGVANRIVENLGYNPQGVAAITVTASPFTYTNADNVSEYVTVDGGTITTVVKNGITLYSFGGAAARCGVWLEPGEAVVTTYTVAPTMNKDRK